MTNYVDTLPSPRSGALKYTKTFKMPYSRFSREVLVRLYDDAEQWRQEAILSRKSSQDPKTNACFRKNFTGREFGKWEDILHASLAPWDEGIEMIERLQREIEEVELPQPVDRRRRQRWNEDEGDEIDLDRLRGGQAYWRECRRRWTDAPQHVTLVVDVGTTAGYASEQVFYRGAVALIAAERLEALGYQAELHAVNFTGFSYGRFLLQAAKLKHASSPLDTSLLATQLSGWYYRSINFQSRHSSGFTTSSEGVGGSKPPTEAMLDEITEDPRRIMLSEIWDTESARDAVVEILSQYADEQPEFTEER